MGLCVKGFCRFFAVLVGVMLAFSAQAAEPRSVNIRVPGSLKDSVLRAIASTVETARLDDEGDVRQLFRRMRPVIRDVLGAQGYFDPEITLLTQDGHVLREGSAQLVVEVKQGELSRIASVNIEFKGAIAGDTEEARLRREAVRALWSLPVGAAFDQGLWDASKNAILSNLLARDYAAATLSDSLADVDPEGRKVYLSVVFDSGPVFTFGALQVEGLSKYPGSLVERYNTIKPGERYEQERLLGLLAELQGTSYFSAVDVKVLPDADKPLDTPIYVVVTESKTKRVGVGAGYSSNTGFRSELSFSDNNVFDRAYALASGLRLEQKRQSAYADLFLPPDRKGVLDSLGVSVDHQDVSNLEVQRTAVGVSREYQLGVTDFKLGVNYQLEDRLSEGVSLGGNKALVGSAIWSHNRVDDRLNPRRGYVAVGQLAAASDSLLSDQSFLRVSGRIQYYWSPSVRNELSTRLELGTVFAGSERDIPQDYLFRAGGTNSLRGVQYLGLGVVSQGVLQGGRNLALSSLEYVHWHRESIGSALFVDVGDVADRWGALDPIASVGVGVRYKTPAGPIALDVAKAQGQDRPRIHFALGVAF